MKEPEHGSGGAVQPSTFSQTVSVGQAAALGRPSILVAVDFSADSEHALLWAFDHARLTDATVEVLHVVHDPANSPGTYRPGNGDPLEPMTDVAERKLAAYLDEVKARHPGIPAQSAFASFCKPGLPVDTILRTAAECGADLVVVGCHGRKGAARLLFGSTSQSVAQKADVPVTIVRANGR